MEDYDQPYDDEEYGEEEVIEQGLPVQEDGADKHLGQVENVDEEQK